MLLLSVQILGLILIPTLAIVRSQTLFRHRLLIFFVITICFIVLSITSGALSNVLVHIPSLFYFGWYGTATLVGLLGLLILNTIFSSHNQTLDIEVFYSSPMLSAAQQCIFNVYLMYNLQDHVSPFIAMIVTASLFAIIHVPLEVSWPAAGVSFIAGLFLIIVYFLLPHFLLATAMHSVLNIVAIKYRLPGIGPSLQRLQ